MSNSLKKYWVSPEGQLSVKDFVGAAYKDVYDYSEALQSRESLINWLMDKTGDRGELMEFLMGLTGSPTFGKLLDILDRESDARFNYYWKEEILFWSNTSPDWTSDLYWDQEGGNTSPVTAAYDDFISLPSEFKVALHVCYADAGGPGHCCEAISIGVSVSKANRIARAMNVPVRFLQREY